MTAVSDLTRKGVHLIEPNDTVAEAARRMCKHAVGALVITDASDTTPLGIITDRDLVWLISEGLDPKETTVDQFVRSRLQTASVADSLGAVIKKMRRYGIRRLPVVDTESHLVGLISLDDILVLLGRELGDAATAIEAELAHEREIGSAFRDRGAAKAAPGKIAARPKQARGRGIRRRMRQRARAAGR